MDGSTTWTAASGRPACEAGAVRGADGLEQLDHGAGPAVGHDQRQRALVLRSDVDEVDLHAVVLGRELWTRVEPLRPAPEVVVARPVVRECLQRRQLDALRPVVDELLARPAGRPDATAQVVDLLLRYLDAKSPDLGGGVDAGAHAARTAARPGAVGGLLLAG